MTQAEKEAVLSLRKKQYSLSAIAETTGLALGTIKSFLSRASGKKEASVTVQHITEDQTCCRQCGATLSVQEADAEQPDVIEDWKLESVARSSDNDIANIMAIFTSETARKHIWKPDGKITVTIKPSASTETATFQAEYKSVGTKKEWYDYLKVWEGHKNEWYDYLKVWDNSVEFERVDNQ